MRRFAPMTGWMLLLGSMLGSVGCGSVSLHPSFGQLYRDVNMAQLSAHPAHEPTVRGTEIQAVVEAHDQSYNSSPGGGGGGGGGGGATTNLKTAGIAPLH